LVRAVPESHLWAESFERDLTDILVLQSEVARAIAREIKIVVTPEEETHLARARPIKPGTHEAYLKGRYHLETETDDGVKLAIEYFRQAVVKDPNYALAYTGLAEAYLVVRSRTLLPRNEAITRAKAAAEKALELDPTLGEAHASLAFILYEHDWDWSGAEREFKNAIELNPNNVNTHHLYSEYLTLMGRLEESLTVIQRLVELDPLSPAMHEHLGFAYIFARRYDQAIEENRKALELDPNYAAAHAALGRAYLHKGMHEEAIAELQQAVELSGGWPKHDLAIAYAMAGKRDDAGKLLDELVKLSKRGFVEMNGVARVYAALGDKEQAFAWLEKAYVERDGWMAALKMDPSFDPLRSDPRFQSLLRRMNFPE
jgi:tetratricopeptide (TPR) repeat protein